MFNYIITVYIVSTVVIWVVFWARISGLESELNTYYYIPTQENAEIKLYVKCDKFSVLVLFVPIYNFVFIIRSMLEDHLALIGAIANKIGAELIVYDSNEEQK